MLFNKTQSMAGIMVASLLCTTSFARGLETRQTAQKLALQKVQTLQINAEEILASSGDLRTDITQALQNANIKTELKKLGITQSEVELRLAAMSDAELKQVQQGAERQAGGEVIIIGLTTILLLVIIYLLVR